MGHIPDDDNYQDFMNASAEEWSKEEKPPSQPQPQEEKHDRWGSPIQDEKVANDVRRWGSEPAENAPPKQDSQPKKNKKIKGWLIAAIVVVVLGVCACLTFAVLEIFQVINIF
jgi:hypothetical protein